MDRNARVNTLGLPLYKYKRRYCYVESGCDRRHNLNVDPCVNTLGVLLYGPLIAKTCTNP